MKIEDLCCTVDRIARSPLVITNQMLYLLSYASLSLF